MFNENEIEVIEEALSELIFNKKKEVHSCKRINDPAYIKYAEEAEKIVATARLIKAKIKGQTV